jgi:N-acyl homoserine lactone hydrolase
VIRRMLRVMLWALALALAALAWTFLPLRLPEPAPFAGELPPASPPPSMTMHALYTGAIASRAAFAFRGGSFLEEREFAMVAVLVRHPRGDLLIDAGFGRELDAHVATTPKLAQMLTRYTRRETAGAQLRAAGIDPSTLAGVIPTHTHWDHISGLDDLPGVPVWSNAAERAFVRDGGERSVLMRSFGEVRWREYAFEDGPYLGFERSLDVWDDGSVVLVPAPGHTPGSVIVFVTLPGGTRHALLGDLVWQKEGILRPAERPWFARRMLAEDDAQVRAAIARVASIQRRWPDVVLVPAHDASGLAKLPPLSVPPR